MTLEDKAGQFMRGALMYKGENNEKTKHQLFRGNTSRRDVMFILCVSTSHVITRNVLYKYGITLSGLMYIGGRKGKMTQHPELVSC